jgi:hypothetical protein
MTQAVLRVVAKEKEDTEKKRALDAALSQIDRAFGKGSVMRLGQREKALIPMRFHRLLGSGRRSASAACRVAAWSKFTVRNRQARPRSRCTWSPKSEEGRRRRLRRREHALDPGYAGNWASISTSF